MLDVVSSKTAPDNMLHLFYNTSSVHLTNQAPVFQTLDSAIHRINHYPVDKYSRNQLRYPPFDNWGQIFSK